MTAGDATGGRYEGFLAGDCTGDDGRRDARLRRLRLRDDIRREVGRRRVGTRPGTGDTVDVDDEAVAGVVEGCRPDWTFADAGCERVETYRLTRRIDEMACLPPWLEDAPPVERDERARQHRAFLEDYLESSPPLTSAR